MGLCLAPLPFGDVWSFSFRFSLRFRLSLLLGPTLSTFLLLGYPGVECGTEWMGSALLMASSPFVVELEYGLVQFYRHIQKCHQVSRLSLLRGSPVTKSEI